MRPLTLTPGLQKPPHVISIPVFSKSVSAQQVLPLSNRVVGRIPLRLSSGTIWYKAGHIDTLRDVLLNFSQIWTML